MKGENNSPTKHGERWLKFYIYWRFPLGFIFGASSIIREINDAKNSGYLDLPIFLIFLFIDIAVYLYRIVVYFSMLGRTPQGYYMNIVLLFVESAYISAARALERTSLFMFFVFFVLFCLIWVLPNYVYFKHRKYLFGKTLYVHDSKTNMSTKLSPEETDWTGNNHESIKYLSNSATQNLDLVSKASDNQQSKESTGQELFCRKCGALLTSGDAFCRKCGTPTAIAPISVTEKTVIDYPASSPEPPAITIVPTEITQADSPSNKPKPKYEIDLLDKSLHPKNRRAGLFIEDAEWDKAEDCLEAVLDEDPTNAYAYIGKLLIDYRVDNTDALKCRSEEIIDNKNFQKAIRFGNEELVEKLTLLL